MKKIAFFVFLLSLPGLLKAQTYRQKGKVTFVTAANVYADFPDMSSVGIGDTLYLPEEKGLKPCSKVLQKTSTSCVAEIFGGCMLEKGDALVHIGRGEEEVEEEVKEEVPVKGTGFQPYRPAPVPAPADSRHQRIRLGLTGATYSTRSLNTGEGEMPGRHRAMLRLSANARQIAETPFSLEAYMYYRRNLEEGIPFQESEGRFNVYNLALQYELEDNLEVVLGRKSNRKVSSIGAIDGLQFEKNLGEFYAGGIVGFKPDFVDFGINTDLFEYGVYAGHQRRERNFYALTTLGVLEQRMLGQIDRRYTYFQHSGTFFRKLNLFGSFELDLYDKVGETVSINPRLVNLYVSATYRFNRKFSLRASYDNRRKIIYYETYKTEVEELLADDQARQGVRLSVQVRPLRYLSTSVSISRRFESENQNLSDNLNGRISYAKLPAVGGRLSLTYNLNRSAYMQSRVFSASYSRALIYRKVYGSFYYRRGAFSSLSSDYAYDRWYAGANLSYRITRNLRFSLLAEISDGSSGKTFRLNTKISKRWDYK